MASIAPRVVPAILSNVKERLIDVNIEHKAVLATLDIAPPSWYVGRMRTWNHYQ